MKKMMSLLKACMTDNMSLFKIKKKDKTKKSGKGLTIFLFILVGMTIFMYTNTFLDVLIPQHMEHVLLSLVAVIVAIFVVSEGIYKAGSLIFNCRDDDLLLSLPIRKSMVVFIRILKFYVFELLYSSLFLIPTVIAYTIRVSCNPMFYIVSVFAIFLLPIIPIAISSIIGAIISATSAKFKNKSFIQIFVSMIALLGVLCLSFNMQGLMNNIGTNAEVISDFIAKVYYPASAYSKLATNFDMTEMLIFVGIHILVLIATIFVISKVYFKVNSGLKLIQKSSGKKSYKMKASRPQVAFIKKEFKRAINTPVLIINAVFGLVLFVVVCIVMAIKFDTLLAASQDKIPFIPESLYAYVPIILVFFIAFGSLTSSITSSMISLEGKAFTTLKSLPVEPYTIIMAKVYTAILMMTPFILIGDLVFYIRFKFNIVEILLTVVASILLPFIAELIGILVNLKYPEMKADTDAEVVKQSGSSNISALLGILIIIGTVILLTTMITMGCQTTVCLIIADFVFFILFAVLLKRVKGKGVERFNKIDV